MRQFGEDYATNPYVTNATVAIGAPDMTDLQGDHDAWSKDTFATRAH
jgi:hypothetical protein